MSNDPVMGKLCQEPDKTAPGVGSWGYWKQCRTSLISRLGRQPSQPFDERSSLACRDKYMTFSNSNS